MGMSEETSKGISRRKFLKILGAGSAAVGVTACADSAEQNVFPNVRGEHDLVPGVAVWYNSTCGECSAGCGIQVRTREGRAVKVEGNPSHPVNRGGLCGLGQASLQHLYDADRIRQPLVKKRGNDGKYNFTAIPWEDAFNKVNDAVTKAVKKKALITGPVNGASAELVASWCSQIGADHIVYDLFDQTALAKASELSFGTYGIPSYDFDKAKVILNFGADFLETWVSPCEFAKGWSASRKTDVPARFVHVEPRLSLTGANADLWLSNKPGTETVLALGLLKLILNQSRTVGVAADIADKARALSQGYDIDHVSAVTGIGKEKILLLAQYLQDGTPSLVTAGGAAAMTEDAVPLYVAVNLLNLVLGNVGTTVKVAAMRKPQSSLTKMTAFIEALRKDEYEVVFVHDANPAFSLPASYDFKYAVRRAPVIVSFGSHLDETADLADYILPAHTSLEAWGDDRSVPGVNSLKQPVMRPVFDTKAFEDSLFEIATRAGKTIATGDVKSFDAYLKESWKKLHQTLGFATDFKRFWTESLERGGYFDATFREERGKVQINPAVFGLKYDVASFDSEHSAADDLLVYPYPSVKTFDGRAANRPWLQELPDPITQVTWDSWAEIHPETAKAKGLADGDVVTLRNDFGEINVPVYITEHVQKGMAAVPLGQGHTRYGRWAEQVGSGNVLDLLRPTQGGQGDSVGLLTTRVKAIRSRDKARMVNVQGSNSQLGRDLAKTGVITATVKAAGHDDHGHEAAAHGADHHHDNSHKSNGHGAGHHEAKQMYNQRPHPLYQWGMVVDLASCTGCSACVVACYAENNIPFVGKEVSYQEREMSWLRIERYYDGSAEELKVNFLPMMCQHCHNAPCEPVCPVYATYHNEEGLNAMIYNRCVGTRYCSNNCSYKVRRFNWFDFTFPEPLNMQLNPDVVKRSVGVMEKCTFCVQRIVEVKDRAKDLGRGIEDGEVQPACAQTCPTDAIAFGNLNDPESKVSKLNKLGRAYKVLDHHINTQPAVTYLEDKKLAV